MRKSMMRIKRIMAGLLAAALVAAGTPVYANVSADSIVADEIEESTVSADDAIVTGGSSGGGCDRRSESPPV